MNQAITGRSLSDVLAHIQRLLQQLREASSTGNTDEWLELCREIRRQSEQMKPALERDRQRRQGIGG